LRDDLLFRRGDVWGEGMKSITFEITGKPIAKARPRFARRGKFVMTYNPQETEEGKIRWEMMAKWRDMDPIPAGVPIALCVYFQMPIPSGMSKKKLAACREHLKKPDLDNLLKTLKDCANGVIWADDSQVWRISAFKEYSDNPRTIITVEWDEQILNALL
jgi:Holliday junction resolvase RusA-like endonuclease